MLGIKNAVKKPISFCKNNATKAQITPIGIARAEMNSKRQLAVKFSFPGVHHMP